MRHLRAFLAGRGHIAVIIIALALCVKALVPAGTMLTSPAPNMLTIAICAPVSGGERVVNLAVPMKDAGGGGQDSPAAGSDHCAFGSLANAALGAADPFLLALAFAFILVLGLAPAPRLPLAAASYLRPPLRGPPATV